MQMTLTEIGKIRYQSKEGKKQIMSPKQAENAWKQLGKKSP